MNDQKEKPKVVALPPEMIRRTKIFKIKSMTQEKYTEIEQLQLQFGATVETYPKCIKVVWEEPKRRAFPVRFF